MKLTVIIDISNQHKRALFWRIELDYLTFDCTLHPKILESNLLDYKSKIEKIKNNYDYELWADILK